MVLSCVDEQDSKHLLSVEKPRSGYLTVSSLRQKPARYLCPKHTIEVLAEDIFSPHDIPMHTNSAAVPVIANFWLFVEKDLVLRILR